MADFPETRKPWQKCVASTLLMPQRMVLCCFGLLAIVNAYTMRICISVTLTQIVLPRNYSNATQALVCPKDFDDDSKRTESVEGRYDWSQSLQGYILSTFYIGYVITHVPGGMAAERYGAKWVLALGMLSTVLLTLITPLAIDKGGAPALIATRFLIGLGEGPTYPALSALLAQWIPLRERGVLGSFVLGGGQIGTIIGQTASGYILANFRWPWVFYIFGFGGFLWVAFFIFLCSDDPSSDPFISPKEKNYLFSEMGRIERNHHLPPTPWRDILTSLPVLTLIFCQVGHDWGFFMMVTDLPKYMNDVLQFPIKKNGLYSSLPYALMFITSVASGYITDKLIARGKVDITKARKVNTGIAAFGPAIFMVMASYAGCRKTLVIWLFVLAMGFMGPYYAGMKLTPLDLSPNYAGTLMALTNGFAAGTGIMVPTLIGWLTPDTTMAQWRIAFWVAFIVLSITVIPYLIYASGEKQPWDDGPTKKGDDKPKAP